jgi:hypothetical protein
MRPGVYVTESVLPAPTPTFSPSTAAGAMVAALPSGPRDVTLVNSWYQFSRVFGPLNRDFEGTVAANMFFRTGGRELYVSRAVRASAVAASVNVAAAGSGNLVWGTFSAASPGAYGNDLQIKIEKNAANLYNIYVVQDGLGETQYDEGLILESFPNLDFGTFGNSEITNAINVRSRFIRFAWATNLTTPGEGEEPEPITPSGLPETIDILTLVGGTDGNVSDPYDFAAALNRLKDVERTFVLFSPGMTDESVIGAMVDFAEENRSFVVLDVPDGLSPTDAVQYAETVSLSAGPTSYAAMYYPHLWVADGTSRSRSAVRKVAPSAAVAGMILGTDASKGVFKAPAGVEAALPGVVALERNLTPAALDVLNNDSAPVNAIRNMPGLGAVVMGARTLNMASATKYVNIRRSMLFLNREMRELLSFALFRNSGPALWAEMTTAIEAYLDSFWAAGGLRGISRDQAFYVKIDDENNTLNDIQAGVVNVEVGVALQYPAEFIRIKLTQTTGA